MDETLSQQSIPSKAILAKHALAILLLLLSPAFITLPLVFHLDSHMYMPGDNFITMWTTAWQVHALADASDSFWDANIFYPYPRTIALSVLRVIYVPFAAIVLWFTNNPVLMENLIILLSMGLSGIGVYVLLYSLTNNIPASFLGALYFCICPERFARIPHPHQINPLFVAPAVYACIHYSHSKQTKWAVLTFLFLFLQFLTSIYIFLFTCIALLIVFLVDIPVWYQQWKNVLLTCMIGLCGIAILIIPFAYPYIQNRMQYDIADTGAMVLDLSARPTDYLCAFEHNLLYGWTSSVFNIPRAMSGSIPPEFLFPGLLAVGMFFYAIYLSVMKKIQWKNNPVLYGICIALAGVILTFGPELHLGTESTQIKMPAYFLYEFVPGFSVLRAPARFSLLVTFGISLVVGGVVTWLWNHSRYKKLIYVLFVFGIVLESTNKPVPLYPIPHGEGIPSVQQWLKDQPQQVIVCYPLRYHLDYMYFSTYHWKKLINGWSGYIPNELFGDEIALKTLPSPEAESVLQRRGAELIVIHHQYDTTPHFRDFVDEEVEQSKALRQQLLAKPDDYELIYDNPNASVFLILTK